MAKTRHRRHEHRHGDTRSTRKSARKTRTKSGFFIKKRRLGISDIRLQRGLLVLREQKDIAIAARAARTTPKHFKRAALRKRAIKKLGKNWIVRRTLHRRMLVFSGGRELTVTVPNYSSARLIGRYMAAVRQFLRTNKRDVLAPFADRSVKDTAGKSHPFETNPNAIYRLASASDQAFEQIYRIVV